MNSTEEDDLMAYFGLPTNYFEDKISCDLVEDVTGMFANSADPLKNLADQSEFLVSNSIENPTENDLLADSVIAKFSSAANSAGPLKTLVDQSEELLVFNSTENRSENALFVDSRTEKVKS